MDRVVKLNSAEHALYSAGIRRGHAETLRQLAGQLQEAAKAVRSMQLSPEQEAAPGGRLAAAMGVFEGVAAQLEQPAAAAAKDQAELLDRFQAARRRPELVDRLRAAMRGALGGWRSGC